MVIPTVPLTSVKPYIYNPSPFGRFVGGNFSTKPLEKSVNLIYLSKINYKAMIYGYIRVSSDK